MVFYFPYISILDQWVFPKDYGWYSYQLPDSLSRIDLLSQEDRSLGCCRVSGKWSMINGRMCSIVCVCVVGDDYCVLVLARCLSAAEGS